MLKVGVMGCGTIGCEICKAIDQGVVSAELTGICDVDLRRAETLSGCLARTVEIRDGPDLIRGLHLNDRKGEVYGLV